VNFIFKGVFHRKWARPSVLGLLVTAIFLLTILQRVWSGPLSPGGMAFRSDFQGAPCLARHHADVRPRALPAARPQAVNPTVLQMVEGLKL
jgi:hypothetical protein